MVHLNGSVEKVANSVWAKILNRYVMPALVAVLVFVVGRGFDELIGEMKAMNGRITANSKAIAETQSAVAIERTVRLERIDPHLQRLDRKIGRCCYTPRPGEKREGP